MALIVYGSNVSPFVRKVRVVLAEKGLEYKLDQINPFAPPPEFLAISPLKRIPVLRDTDLPEPNTLPDSTVIGGYLEHKHPTPALYPSDPFSRARAMWFEEYADSAMALAFGPGLFFERVVKKMMRKPTEESICQTTLREKAPPIFDYLEKELGANQFLVGDRLSVADIAVGSVFVNFEHAGETVDGARWPALAAYLTRIHGRPSFEFCIDEERPLVQRFRAA